LTRRPWFTWKKTKIMFFSQIWPDGHDLWEKKSKLRFFVKFDSTTMNYREKTENTGYAWDLTRRQWFCAKKTEITFFRENWPGDHDLARKKPKVHFFVKLDPMAMSYAEKTQITFFSWNMTRRLWFSAKKTRITFFHKIWPNDHDLARKKQKFFLKFDPTAISYSKITKITFFVKFDPTAMI
jgi:hypothetical protein